MKLEKPVLPEVALITELRPGALEIFARVELRKRAKKARRKLSRVQTRSTYAWKERNRAIVTVQPLDVGRDVHYLPPGQTGTWDIRPNFTLKASTRYVLFKKRPKGHKLYQVQDGFKLCCLGGTEAECACGQCGPQYCEKPACINCYMRDCTPPKGFMWYAAPIGVDPDGDIQIKDALGVHAKGHRGQGGKAFDEDVRQTYKLTSTQHKYKGNRQRQRAPRKKPKKK